MVADGGGGLRHRELPHAHTSPLAGSRSSARCGGEAAAEQPRRRWLPSAAGELEAAPWSRWPLGTAGASRCRLAIGSPRDSGESPGPARQPAPHRGCARRPAMLHSIMSAFCGGREAQESVLIESKEMREEPSCNAAPRRVCICF